MPRLTANDKKWLAANYPELTIFERPRASIIEGRLVLNGSYAGVELSDSYKIRLELFENSEIVPRLTETAGRLKQVLYSHLEFKGDWSELHVYPDERLCLAAPQELRLIYLPDPTALRLFKDYIDPYFYSQSFFELYGRWPWEHLPHNTKGIMTWYLDNYEIEGAAKETLRSLNNLAKKGQTKAIRTLAKLAKYDSFSPHIKCLCGSGRRQGNCHKQYIKLALSYKTEKYTQR